MTPKIADLMDDEDAEDDDDIFIPGARFEDQISTAEHARKRPSTRSEDFTSTSTISASALVKDNDDDDDDEIFIPNSSNAKSNIIGSSSSSSSLQQVPVEEEEEISIPTSSAQLTAAANILKGEELVISNSENPVESTGDSVEAMPISNTEDVVPPVVKMPATIAVAAPPTEIEVNFWDSVKKYNFNGMRQLIGRLPKSVNLNYAFHVLSEMLKRDISSPQHVEFLKLLFSKCPNFILWTYPGNRRILAGASQDNVNKLIELFPENTLLMKALFHDCLVPNGFNPYSLTNIITKDNAILRKFVFENEAKLLAFERYNQYNADQRMVFIRILSKFIEKNPESSLEVRIARRLFRIAIFENGFTKIDTYLFQFLNKISLEAMNSICDDIIFTALPNSISERILEDFFSHYNTKNKYDLIKKAVEAKRLDLIEIMVKTYGIDAVASPSYTQVSLIRFAIEIESSGLNMKEIEKLTYEQIASQNLFPMTRLILKACSAHAMARGQSFVDKYVNLVITEAYGCNITAKFMEREAKDISKQFRINLDRYFF